VCTTLSKMAQLE